LLGGTDSFFMLAAGTLAIFLKTVLTEVKPLYLIHRLLAREAGTGISKCSKWAILGFSHELTRIFTNSRT
jgi:hypothetical protein